MSSHTSQYQKLTLKNGARLILAPQENTQAATVLVLFRVGSRYETHDISGVSHYIEHMMFKGTKRRPTTTDISRALDSVGAEYNAFTSKDMTGYYVKADARHTDLALDILEDMLFHSKIEEEEFNRERKVIHEEIHMYRDNPMMRIEEIIEEEVFAGNTLGWPIAGTDDTMNMITRAKMLNYLQSYYIPRRAVVALAGKIDKKTIELVKKLFSNFHAKSQAGKKFKKFIPKPFATPRVKIEYKDTEQAQLAIGFPAYKYSDPRLPALTLLSNILGGTMSSRLFISVRERKGLAYFIRSAIDVYEDTGSLQVRAGLARGRMEEALGTIMEELAKIKKGVTAEEINRAKENIRGKMAIDLEESSEIASFYGRQELFTNKTLTPEEKIARILKVGAKDIKAVANNILKQNKLSLAVIGPYKDEKMFVKLLKL